MNTQIFTLANPVRFGLKWFVTEEEILVVFTVYEAAARKLQNSPGSVYKYTTNID